MCKRFTRVYENPGVSFAIHTYFLLETRPEVFGEVKERIFCPKTKCYNAHDLVVLHAFRRHLFANTFEMCG